MRTWLSRTAPALGVLLAAVAATALTGCTSAGGLHDAGATRPLTSRPSPVQLWPAAAVSQTPTPAVTSQPPPTPIPGITAPGDDIQRVDPPAVLAQDPAIKADEKAALAGCTGCLVRPAQYRDLTGDGHDELLTAVLTGEQRAFLHVYTLRERQVLPILALQVLPGFTADTVGADLVVREPTNEVTVTSSTYRWDLGRLAFRDRQIKSSGPAADVPGCPATPAPDPSPPGNHPPAAPSRTPAPIRPSSPLGGSGSGGAPVPTPPAVRATPAPPAVPGDPAPVPTPARRS
ncbi:hypothetical protein [Kitasatospora sp. NPDC050543]|uniref:hypothetical protein n=1 Tax=Kitasatospora sp. NPDC050543 TaxID=3364054 RepID=UPI0037BC687B